MNKTILFFLGCWISGTSLRAQEAPRVLKGGGHELGETAEQFYAEGPLGNVFRACQANDWKNVRQSAKDIDPSTKINAKDLCAKLLTAEQQATSGMRLEYKGTGDRETMRSDTFTFDEGRLVKIELVYSAPVADILGFHPKSFAELFAGLKEAYGTPTKSYSEPVISTYGVKLEAHRAFWIGRDNVISIIEQPGTNARTEIIAETLAEHGRAAQTPKTTNPLH